MKINQQKTKIMLFNTSTTNDFQPEMKIDGIEIEVVEQMKLLGVIISNGMRIPTSFQRRPLGDCGS